MKKGLMFFGLFCLLLVGACSGSSGPVKINSVTLARDDGNGNAGETVTSFRPTDHVLHATVTLDRLETGLKVKLSWVAIDAGGQQNVTIAEKEFSSLVANTIDGSVSLPNDWPTGKYRLNIYLNDTLQPPVDFNVA